MLTSNLPDTKFKTLVIGMLNEHKERIDKIHENFHKEIETIKIEIKGVGK